MLEQGFLQEGFTFSVSRAAAQVANGLQTVSGVQPGGGGGGDADGTRGAAARR